MNISKITNIVILCLLLAAGIYVYYRHLEHIQHTKALDASRLRRERMIELVKSGKLKIDQESHTWGEEPDKIECELYLRNLGDIEVAGDVVFSVTLDSSGLEEKWLKALVRISREELIAFIKRHEPSPRLNAIHAYLQRGEILPEGKSFEPVIPDSSVESYRVCVHRSVTLSPMEGQKYVLEIELPPKFAGYLFRVKADSIFIPKQ